METEAQKRARLKWEATNTVQVKLKLHTTNDADVIKRLEEVPNKQGYIKDLIRQDIAKSGK